MYTQHAQYMLLFLVLAVNSNQFQILQELLYMLLLKLPILIRSCFVYLFFSCLQHLLDIGSCVSLARPLINYCCQRLAILFDLDQKLRNLQVPPILGTPAEPVQPNIPDSTEMNEEDDKDSVFNHPIKSEKEEGPVKQDSLDAKTPSSGKSPDKKIGEGKLDSTIPEVTVSKEGGSIAPADGDIPVISKGKPDKPAHFGLCPHHSGMMLQLSCIIQTIAIKCPTAFVHTRVSTKGMASKDSSKCGSPLSLLPVGLPDLPMPSNISEDLQRKVIVQRN